MASNYPCLGIVDDRNGEMTEMGLFKLEEETETHFVGYFHKKSAFAVNKWGMPKGKDWDLPSVWAPRVKVPKKPGFYVTRGNFDKCWNALAGMRAVVRARVKQKKATRVEATRGYINATVLYTWETT